MWHGADAAPESSPLRPLGVERQGEVGRCRKYDRAKQPNIETAVAAPPLLTSPPLRGGEEKILIASRQGSA